MIKLNYFIFLFQFLMLPLIAQKGSPFQFEQDDQLISIETRMAQENAKGVSLYILKNLEIDTTFQWGVRDEAQQLPVNEETRFQFGGMSAALVHFAILRLVNDGKIDLDANVNNYLSKWKLPETKFSRKNPVTIRDLLLQKRGFKSISKPQGYVEGSTLPNLLQMLNGATPSQEAAAFLKSDKNKSGNSSFFNDLILQLVLEEIHQKSFSEVMDNEVLNPLGLSQSIYRAQLNEEEKINAALGHDDNGNLIEGGRQVYPELASAGLWSTARDFGQFAAHIFKAAKGEDNRFISQDLAKASITPQEGWRSLIFFKEGNIYWGGASNGFYCQFGATESGDRITVTCINTNLRWKLCGEIRGKAEIILDQLK